MKAEHTQTPWTCELLFDAGAFRITEAFEHESGLDDLEYADAVADANQAFIELACNNFMGVYSEL